MRKGYKFGKDTNLETENDKLRDEVFNLKIQLKSFEMPTPTQIDGNELIQKINNFFII